MSVALVGVLGLFFFGTAIYAFVWARRQRQFSDFEKGARSIFNEEEPEGRLTDQLFADAKKKSPEKDDDDAKHTSR